MPDLRFTSVPDPPAGEDWQFTIPGQYVYHLTSLSATLTTAAGSPDVAADASGNGRTAFYDNRGTGGWTQHVAGLVAGDFAATAHSANSGFLSNFYSPDFSTSITAEMWLQVSDLSHDQLLCVFADTVPGNANLAISLVGTVSSFPYAAGTIVYDVNNGSDEESTTAPVITDTLSHMLDFVIDPAAGRFRTYVDGTKVDDIFDTPFTPSFATNATAFLTEGAAIDLTFDEVAVYESAQSDATITARYAAATTSFVAYTANVLAGTPAFYYHMNDPVAAGGPRTVNLDITDGTNLVNEVAPPIPGSGATLLQYSWLPNLQTDFTTADGSVVIVGTPDLVLGAGYTVGTRTPDLGLADQWSDVTVWWYDELAFLLISLLEYHDILIIS